MEKDLTGSICKDYPFFFDCNQLFFDALTIKICFFLYITYYNSLKEENLLPVTAVSAAILDS